MPRFAGWKGFLAWALAGGLLVFAVLSGFSMGLFVLPLAGVLLWFVARRASGWPESLGLGAGLGAVCLLVAFSNRSYKPCPEGPITLAPGETEFECGGFDPLPWLIAGLSFVLFSAVLYAFARRSRAQPPAKLRLSQGERIALLVAIAFVGFGLMIVFESQVSEGGGVEDVLTVTVESPTP